MRFISQRSAPGEGRFVHVGLDLQSLSEALARLQPQSPGCGQVAGCQGLGFSSQRSAPVEGRFVHVGLDLQGLSVGTRGFLQPEPGSLWRVLFLLGLHLRPIPCVELRHMVSRLQDDYGGPQFIRLYSIFLSGSLNGFGSELVALTGLGVFLGLLRCFVQF